MNARMRLLVKVGITSAIVLGALLVLVVMPLRAVFRLQGELRFKSNQLLADTELIAQFEDPDEEFKKIEEKQRNLETRFPTAKAIPFVLQQLGEKSREQGLDILSIRPLIEEEKTDKKEKSVADFERKKILLELTCNYQALGEYLASLNTMQTFFTVEELQVRGEAGPDSLGVQIVLGFYVGPVAP